MPTRVRTTDLLDLAAAALAPAGEAAAGLVARALVDAEVRGHHRFGLRLLDGLPAGSRDELSASLSLPASGDLERASTSVDLAGRFAPTAVAALIDPARRAAREHGVSLVRLREVGPFGRLAPFVAAVAQRGAIGLLTMSSKSFVAPHGGHRAVLGTNPFALAVPTRGHPLVVDTASSAITAAHWHDAQSGQSRVPEGALVDATGAATTSAADAVAIAARGGLLGTSIGIAIEALTAAATGLLSDPAGAPRGGLLLVIEPTGDAADAGEELAGRLVEAGGRVPGQPVPWPDSIDVDAGRHRFLTLLAALA
ncbi:MAG: Ldh family oxidoreductase [Propionicimonas sp.]|nr:Ldh family oxidoreductase [Propionicimonas sp.]